MATHSSILAWKIPWTEEHGRLQSMGSQNSQTLKNSNRDLGGNFRESLAEEVILKL